MLNHSALSQKFFRLYQYLDRENRTNDKVMIVSEVDMSQSIAIKEKLKSNHQTSPCITAIMVKAITMAVKKHPYVNSIHTGFLFKKKINLKEIDFSVAVERNLPTGEMLTYAAAIRNSDQKDLLAIDSELRSLARMSPENDSDWMRFYKIVKYCPTFLAGMICSSPLWSKKLWQQYRGGALFISSPCKYGGDLLVSSWPWPVSFSFGLMKDRPVVVKGKVEVRPTINVTLSFDRRYIPGAPAARFFSEVINCLETGAYFDSKSIEDQEEKKIVPLRA